MTTPQKNGTIGFGHLGYGTMQLKSVTEIGKGLEAHHEENIFANNKSILTLGKNSIFYNNSLNKSFVKDYNSVAKDVSIFSKTKANNFYSNTNYSTTQNTKTGISAPASTGVSELFKKMKSIFS